MVRRQVRKTRIRRFDPYPHLKMKPSEYIQSRLDDLKKIEVVDVSKDKLVETIVNKILSKKFRKYAVDEAFREHVNKVVSNSVKKNEPITMVWVFGGYKLWRIPTAPEADWGELFSMIYFARYAKTIAEVYKPGIVFDFYSDDVIVSRMDNIPQKDVDAYQESFRKLLGFVSNYLPDNVKFTYNRVADQYGPGEFEKELEKNIEKLKSELPGGLPQMNEVKDALVELNVKLKPGQDEDPDWKAKVMLVHDAYSISSKRRPYYRSDEKLMVVNTALPCTIAIGTTKASVAKFWCGMGVLEKRGEKYLEKILSPSQLEKAKLVREEVSIEGLEGENFQEIKIV